MKGEGPRAEFGDILKTRRAGFSLFLILLPFPPLLPLLCFSCVTGLSEEEVWWCEEEAACAEESKRAFSECRLKRGEGLPGEGDGEDEEEGVAETGEEAVGGLLTQKR